MPKYILKNGELYNAKTGYRKKKVKLGKGKFAKEYWAVYVDGKQYCVQATLETQKELLDMYHVDYVEEV